MKLGAFEAKCLNHVNKYLAEVERALQDRSLRITSADGKALAASYPTNLLVYELPQHFAAELVGASSSVVDIEAIRLKSESLDTLINGVASGGSALMALQANGNDFSLTGGDLFRGSDKTLIEERFGFLLRSDGASFVGGEGFDGEDFIVFRFDGTGSIWLRDVLCVGSVAGVLRPRYFQNLWIVDREMSSSAFVAALQDKHPRAAVREKRLRSDPNDEQSPSLLSPTHRVGADRLVRAANFASLASIDRIGETTITSFVEQNSEVLVEGLGGRGHIASPRLPWIEGPEGLDDDFIVPDFILVDSDGAGHICDFKLPLLGMRDVTRGGRRRRRFKDAVDEGIAQLANYEEYFQYQANRTRFVEQYSVDIAAEPRLILVVGTSENVDPVKVKEAGRALRGTFEIVDYDSLRTAYLVRGGFGRG